MSLTRGVLIEQVQELEQERDALREQMARLEVERDGCRDSSLYWLQKASERFEDIRRLRAALEKYGQHTERCCIPMVPDGPECTCGLEEALNPPAAPAPAAAPPRAPGG